MAAWRYTRLEFDAGGDCLLIDVELRGVAGGPDLTDPALATTRASGTAGWYTSNEGPDKAFDSASGTFWQARGTPGPILIWDAGAGNAIEVRQIQLTAHASFLGRTPTRMLISGSNDGVNWTVEWGYVNFGTWSTAVRTFDYVVPGVSAARVTTLAAKIIHAGVATAPVRASTLAAEAVHGSSSNDSRVRLTTGGVEVLRSTVFEPTRVQVYTGAVEVLRSVANKASRRRALFLG
jgi:hypothetical protein